MQFWAKTSKDSDEFHTVLFHSIDSGMVAKEWLKQDEVMNKKFELLLPDMEIMNLIPFLCSLHDLGKVSYGFQLKQPQLAKKLGINTPDDYIKNLSGYFNHGIFTYYSLFNLSKNKKMMIEGSIPKIKNLYQAIGSHHGQVVNLDMDTSRRMSQEWNDNGFIKAEQLNIINTLASVFGVNHQIKFDSNIHWTSLSTLLAGFISVSDWMASNEYYFSFESDMSVEKYITRSSDQARNILKESGLLKIAKQNKSLDWQSIFGFNGELRPIQKHMADNRLNGLTIIEAPMGEGKTEASLIQATHHINSGLTDGIYFALPTRATSNAIYSRLMSFLENTFSESQLNLVLAHSSNWALDEYRETYSSYQTNDIGKIVSMMWLRSSKRVLLSPFGVGTIDQAMNATLAIKHYFVRLMGLSRNVLIFDEIHSYDTYMNGIILELLRWMGKLQVPVILLSATLTSVKRKEMVSAYLNQESVKLELTDYPLITYTKNNEVFEEGGFKPAINKEFKIKYIKQDIIKLADIVLEQTSHGGVICCLMNTVKRAQTLYSELIKKNDDIEIILFHSRYTMYDRSIIEKDLLDRIGKKGNRPKKAIIVSTQVIEQSLDLDFDLMISDLAPIDLLIQRLGRVHRHERTRLDIFKDPEFWILFPEGNEPIGNCVYDKYIVANTINVLRDRTSINIPEDIRTLIDDVYKEMEKQKNIINNIIDFRINKDKYQQYYDHYVAENVKMENYYKHVCVHIPLKEKFPNPTIGLLEEENDNQKMLQIKTRLGNNSLSCVLLFKRDGKIYTADNKKINTHSEEYSNDEIQSLFLSIISIPASISKHLKELINYEVLKQVPMFRHTPILLLENNSIRHNDITIEYLKDNGLQIRKDKGFS